MEKMERIADSRRPSTALRATRFHNITRRTDTSPLSHGAPIGGCRTGPPNDQIWGWFESRRCNERKIEAVPQALRDFI